MSRSIDDERLLWRAVRGLRRDLDELSLRVERHLAGCCQAEEAEGTKAVEDHAARWKKVRDEEIERLNRARADRGKGEELDEEDEEELGAAWMNG